MNYPKKSKYNNKPTTLYGITFSSIKESEHYLVLRDLMNRGAISDLELQPKFILQCEFTDNMGVKHKKIEYWADFQYFDKKKKCQVVEDVKGMKTDVYELKKKMFLYSYQNLLFVEV
jgi:hypothetical protein